MQGRGTAAEGGTGGGMLTDDGIGVLASPEPPSTRDNVVVAGSLLRADGSGEVGNAVYGTTSLRRDITVSPSDGAWHAWFGWRPYGSPDRRRCGATGLSGARRTWRAPGLRYGKRTITQACCFSITVRAASVVVVDVTGRAEGVKNRRFTLHGVSWDHVLSNASTVPPAHRESSLDTTPFHNGVAAGIIVVVVPEERGQSHALTVNGRVAGADRPSTRARRVARRPRCAMSHMDAYTARHVALWHLGRPARNNWRKRIRNSTCLAT